MENKTLKLLNEFISKERSRFSNLHNNMFAFSFSQVVRYYQFILIIFERYKKTNKRFLDHTEQSRTAFKPGKGKVTKEQARLLDEGRKLSTLLHLEIESFYLFSNILLDKVSNAVEFYFGKADSNSLASHRKLSKNIKGYCSSKTLNIDDSLVKQVQKLKKNISDFRDKQITHEKSPRTLKATVFSGNTTRIASNRLYPNEKDVQVEGKALSELLDEIDKYIDAVVNLIQANSDKTNLDLEQKKE